MVDDDGTTSYTYDELNRLIHGRLPERYPRQRELHLRPDGQPPDDGPGWRCHHYTYDAADRLLNMSPGRHHQLHLGQQRQPAHQRQPDLHLGSCQSSGRSDQRRHHRQLYVYRRRRAGWPNGQWNSDQLSARSGSRSSRAYVTERVKKHHPPFFFFPQRQLLQELIPILVGEERVVPLRKDGMIA